VPRPSRPPEHYIRLAKQAIRELVDTADATVPAEMEARISDMQWKSLPYPIDPHHVTTARAELVAENVLASATSATLGNRQVTVFHFKDTRGRLTAIRNASARKRLLQGRYQGWASGTPKAHGVIGPAAERVLHASLVAAAPHGYRLVNPDGGEVREVLGAPVPGGPLDNGAFFQPLDATGLPEPAILLPIEAKNVRSWIYPRAPELHQVLYKGAALKVAHPNLPIVPVLMCRRAVTMTFWMAEQLGFQVIQAKAQFLPPDTIDPQAVQEVRNGLGYFDLTQGDDAHPFVVWQLQNPIPDVASVRADRWAASAPVLVDFFRTLRDTQLSNEDREKTMIGLRAAASSALGVRGGW
jgi:hypothetical protein